MRARFLAAAFVALLMAASVDLQAATPFLTFNNSTGSDTGASGAPPTLSPIFAAATCDTGGVNTTVINWPANGFAGAGVPTDGSAILWLKTASGRQYTQIVSYTANTVTVRDNFNISAAAKVDCATGGKRRTIAGSTQVFPDIHGPGGSFSGWTVQFDATGTNYTTGAALSFTGSGLGCIVQSTTGGMAVIEGTGNTTLFGSSQCDVLNLNFINTSGTKTTTIALQTPTGLVQGNIIGGTTTGNSFLVGIAVDDSERGIIYANEIRFNTTGIRRPTPAVVLWNWIHNNTDGINYGGCGPAHNGLVFRNLIVNNNVGVNYSTCTSQFHDALIENVIDGNTSHGVDYQGAAWGKSLVNNQITNNGGAGVRCNSGTADCGRLVGQGLVAFNNYSGNSGGNRVNWPVGENETATPPGYVNAGGNNYCLTSHSPAGGPPVQPLGTYANSLTRSFIFQGACQPNLGSGFRVNLGI